MGNKFLKLFVIKNRLEACAVIYALAVGAISRGMDYLAVYPGVGGWLLMSVCPIAVVMAGSRLLELTRKDNGQRRRQSDYPPPGGFRRRDTDHVAQQAVAGTPA
jgi:hypothetical protein